ncbi:hypothetical protein DFH09DRAFT_1144974, partial [Mycena vulgaris]
TDPPHKHLPHQLPQQPFAFSSVPSVVRFTNKDIIYQIVYARLQGDLVLVLEHSRELPRYGIKHGLTAAYATDLLCARRALTRIGLADKYKGVSEADGTLTMTEVLDEEDAPCSFKAFLDVGLQRTLTGSWIFGAMKGATLPGYDPESKVLDSEVLKKCIFGGHVAEYMESLEEEGDERFKQGHRGHHIAGHAAIREDPSFKPTDNSKDWKSESTKFMDPKLTHAQRKERIAAKIEKFKAGGDAPAADEDNG